MTIEEIAEAAAGLVAGAEVQTLMPCARRAVNEVATEYFPTVETATLRPVDGFIAFDAFERFPRRVYAVRRKGTDTAYALTATGIRVDGTDDVTVSFAAADGGVDERIPLRTYAYGTAAEYCLLNGLFDEAALYDKRFRDSLARLHIAGVRLPKRRWL